MPTYAHIPKIDGSPPDGGVAACFERLTSVLLAFASRHSMLVRKYYQNQPMWSFHFLHPRGGFGMVQIHASPAVETSFRAAIASHWWIDDQEKCERSAASRAPVSIEGLQAEDILPALEEALAVTLRWTATDLTRKSRTTPRRRDSAGNYVFAEFEKAQRLPT